MSFWHYLDRRWGKITPLIVDQVELIAVAILLATLLAVGLGLLTWRRAGWATAILTLDGALLTIPSLALLALMIPIFGLGWTPTLIALVAYAQLPIYRNTVVGLGAVDPAVMESASGMGMSSRRTLLTVQLPLAWPIVLTGVRVATMLIFGISAIAAYVQGPGLGNLMFDGLARFGSVNSTNQALAGALGITVLALLFDIGFVLLRRLTTSKGIRA